MRTVIAAAILALPTLVSAQAMHTGVSSLVASVDAPAFAFQAGAVSAAAPRVFTGLIAPIRLNALTLAPSKVPAPAGTVVVEYTVDATGVPQNVQVVNAADKETGERVAAAVRNVRYTPGKLNGQPVAVPVTLKVALEN
jgi:TonB family protein